MPANVLSQTEFLAWRQAVRTLNRRNMVVTLTGCFDLLHVGHVNRIRRAQAEAAELGGPLVVGVNSDRSVRELKGDRRPVVPEQQRAELVAAVLRVTDVVVVFDGTSEQFRDQAEPVLHVTGEEHRHVPTRWPTLYLPRTEGVSTSGIIGDILNRYNPVEASPDTTLAIRAEKVQALNCFRCGGHCPPTDVYCPRCRGEIGVP